MNIYKIIRYFLFLLPPELSHVITLKTLLLIDKIGLLKPSSIESQNSFKYKGLQFKNKIGLAAGLDKNGDYIKPLSKLGFGFIEVGTVTPKPQKGNMKPRLFRIVKSKSLINRFGFNNKGVDYAITKISALKDSDIILGINIGKNKDTHVDKAIDDYLYCMEKVYTYVDYITINISSPNTENLRRLQSQAVFNKLILELKKTQKRLHIKNMKYTPFFIKISPDLTVEEIKDIADIVIEYDVDGVILTNTTTCRDNLPISHKYKSQAGGLSGALLYDKSNKVLKYFSDYIKSKSKRDILLIGVGGIDSYQKANTTITNGADLIQIYSGLVYEGPSLVKTIAQKISSLSIS
jgi:dihydroorotate dehydrogenase